MESLQIDSTLHRVFYTGVKSPYTDNFQDLAQKESFSLSDS